MINVGILAELDPVKEIAAHELFRVSIAGYDIVFSNHMLMIMVSSLFLMVMIPFAIRKKELVRHGLGNFVEGICVFVREDIARPFLAEKTDKYIGYLWTLFFFVAILNLFGLVPFEKFFTAIVGKPMHIGGAPTANIWVTGGLAFLSFLFIHISGVRTQGFWKYLKNFAPPVPMLIKPFVYLIEFMSSFIKPFALAVRLFANIFAGHVLLSVVLSFILIFKNFVVAGGSIMFAVLMSFIELFVACLQAYIFTFLTAIFISFSITEDH